MKRWPLRLKIALYAVLLAGAALAIATVAVLAYVRHREIAQMDARLGIDARELFRDYENFAASPKRGSAMSELIVPLALRGRYVELFGQNGAVLFRSANLGGATLAGERPQFHTREFAGQALRVGVFREGDLRLIVGAPLAQLEEMEKNLCGGFLLALPLLAAAGLGGGLWLGRRALRPVVEITRAARQITAERLDARLPVPAARDEIGELTRVLNETFDRLERGFEQSKRFSADASHQLKTPVTVMRSGLEELARRPNLEAEDQQAIEALVHQTYRLSSLIEDLLLLARADAGRLELELRPLDLCPLLEAALDDLGAVAGEEGVAIETDLPASLHAVADPMRVAPILQNLFENALKYNRRGGRVRVTARREGAQVIVSIANTGPPIPPEARERIFERFHRARIGEELRGHGLGLNIARELARAQLGELRLGRSDAEWTELEMRLPAA